LLLTSHCAAYAPRQPQPLFAMPEELLPLRFTFSAACVFRLSRRRLQYFFQAIID